MTGWRRPVWWTVALAVAAASLFVYLGVWQLDRADFKDALVRRYAAVAKATPQDFSRIADAPPADSFPRVAVRGRYLADRQYLLDNPRHDRRGGVEVYVPFHLLHGDAWLLVDLGFLPGNGDDHTPDVPALPSGEVALQGLYLPPPGAGLKMGGDAFNRQSTWPKTSIYLDLRQVAVDLHHRLYPRVLALDADPAAIYVRARHDDFSSMPPARHRAYAFQWFSFAAAVVVIFLVLHRKQRI